MLFESNLNLCIPFENFFSFYEFNNFLKEHNFLSWEEFFESENLNLVCNYFTDSKKISYIIENSFSIKITNKIPLIILFKKKSLPKKIQKWFVIENIFKNNSELIQIKLWASNILKEKHVIGVKNWFSLIFEPLI